MKFNRNTLALLILVVTTMISACTATATPPAPTAQAAAPTVQAAAPTNDLPATAKAEVTQMVSKAQTETAPKSTTAPAPTTTPASTDGKNSAKSAEVKASIAKVFSDKVKTVKEDRGKEVVILKGFDLNDFGGEDTLCTLKELSALELREEVGSPDDKCKHVVEWSLKYGAETIASGVYPMKPSEWFRIIGNVSGGDLQKTVRFVGTMWRIPPGWNSHMFAANMAADWAVKNPTETTIVGLSPTDSTIVDGYNKLAK